MTIHRCLNGRASPYPSDYCVPLTGADTRLRLRSANRQLFAVSRLRLNTYTAIGPFPLPAPQSAGTLFRASSETQRSVQTVSDVYLQRLCCSPDTSAFTAGCGRFAVKTFRRQTLRRQCRTFRRHILLHKDRIPRHRHPRRQRSLCNSMCRRNVRHCRRNVCRRNVLSAKRPYSFTA